MQKAIWALVFSFWLSTFALAKDDCLTINSSFEALDLVLMPRLKEAFAAEGVCLTFRKVPGRRSTVLMREGKSDGEMLRIGAYEKEVQDFAFPVPEPLVIGYGLIVSLDEESLKQTANPGEPLSFIDGFRWHEPFLSADQKLLPVPDYSAGFMALEADRAAGLIIDNFSFMHFKDKTRDYAIRVFTPESPAYLFLHNRHKDKADAFSAIIKNWREEIADELDMGGIN